MNRRSRRINRWVDDLLHDRSPRRLRRGQADADVLAAAIEMRATGPDAGLPDPHFVESLRQRLARETQGVVPSSPRLTRRTLLASGGLAAAAAAGGLVVGERRSGSGDVERQLVPEGAGWVPVASAADLPEGSAIPFRTAATQGFLVNRSGEISALSGICTHLGCTLHLSSGAQRLDCPCHRAAFALDGSVLYQSMSRSLPPLPRLKSRVREGKIEVLTV